MFETERKIVNECLGYEVILGIRDWCRKKINPFESKIGLLKGK